MTTRDHPRYQEEAGAYLLGALTDLERQAFERHMESCAECRDEVERLRPAADALPRAVEQVAPPQRVKASLMEVVEREARARDGAGARRPLRARLVPRLAGIRPAFAAAALVLGLAVGFGVAQLGGEETRTVVATVDTTRIPNGTGSLRIQGNGDNGAILRVQGLPSLRGKRVYQAWVQRDGSLIPQPTFEVSPTGGGAVAVPDDLSHAKAILVTREARGGARAPTEKPILSVPL